MPKPGRPRTTRPPRQPRDNSESILVADIGIAFGSLPDLFIWRSNTGVAIRASGAPVRFNVNGTPDFLGVMAPSGRAVGIEAKSVDGTQRAAQIVFQAAWESRGGLYLLVRSVEEVRVGLRAAGVRC